MKVGFDGILLGAWADLEGCQRILDVGTGTGLVALMAAQRTERHGAATLIDAIEVDDSAVRDATRNFAQSTWLSRLNLIQDRFQDWVSSTSLRYDLIVSNPPFFPADERQRSFEPSSRTIARRQCGLEYRDLFEGAACLLREKGRLCLIIPIEQHTQVVRLADEFGLSPCRELEVRPTHVKPPHRILIDFRRDSAEAVESKQLTIELSRHVYSEDFKKLARDFYLAF